MSDAVRRPCSDFMDMLRRLINYRIIIIIIIMSASYTAGPIVCQLQQRIAAEHAAAVRLARTYQPQLSDIAKLFDMVASWLMWTAL